MIPLFIPTRNRACQLKLALDSLKKNGNGIFTPCIVWKADNDAYRAGYEKVMSELNMHTIWVEETDLVTDLYTFLHNIPTHHFGLMMDDCIFFKKAEFNAIDVLEKLQDDTWCVSLRLGKNTIIHDYIRNTRQPDLNVSRQDGEFVYWDMHEYPSSQNYGFHFSWDGIVYRKEDILRIFNGTDFTNTSAPDFAIITQKIENYMMNRKGETKRDMMCSPEYSHVVCMAYNSTHWYDTNCGSIVKVSLEEMNEKLLSGWKVDLDSIDFSNIRSTHDEVSFKWREQ